MPPGRSTLKNSKSTGSSGKTVPFTRGVNNVVKGGGLEGEQTVEGRSQGTVRSKPGSPRDWGRIQCWGCHGPGHIAANCPLTTEPMECDTARRSSLYARSVFSAETVSETGQQICHVKVDGYPGNALLDSGSLVTLIHASLVDPGTLTGRYIGVLCIHGDTKEYPTALVQLKSTCGTVSHEVGVVETLMHSVILGRDFPLFWDLWKQNVHCARNAVNNVNVCPVVSPEPFDQDTEVQAVGVTTIESDRFPLAVLAGEAEEQEEACDMPELEMSRDNFGTAQLRDPTLLRARENPKVINGEPQYPNADKEFPYMAINQDLLYRVDKIRGEIVEQLAVPQPYRRMVLDLAHKHAMGGHLGTEKTTQRVLQRFYWPGVHRAVEDYCKSCPDCQLTAPMTHFRSPLVPLPIIEVPFDRIAMDLVGPLVKSSRGFQYILVVLDYATRYPEAIPLRNTSSKSIAKELFNMFTRTGIPKEILTDQGTPFMSKVTKELCKLLKIKHLRTSVYHPQTDGLVERFNKTLKGMLKRVVSKDGKDWDCLLPYLMFAVREVPQSSTGFSPFELMYGRHPRGLLDIAKETWEQETTPYKSVIEHISLMQDRIAAVMPIVREHLEQSQEAQRRVYNRSARVRSFNPGDRVLVLVPTVESKFLAKWQGPYEIIEKVGSVNYKVYQPGKRKPEQLYHVNLIKPWKDRETLTAVSAPSSDNPEVRVSETLSNSQKQETKELVQRNYDVFSELPGRTTAIKHDIVTEPGVRVHLKPYRVPEARRQAISGEVKKMLDLGVIEESKSDWSSPIVLIPKPDGSLRFCNDFRKLNEVSKFDAYPMPRVDELIERLGHARYFSTLDLTKGYWQVPLTDSAKEKTAFVTPDGLFQYLCLPFGLHGAPATFQRLMDIVLKPHRQYASAYLDDIIIFSDDWKSHLPKVQAVLNSLREAGLTANPKKCALGLEEARYLGYVIGRGIIKPQINKVEAIQDWPRPSTKKQVRAFLGILGYYRRFVPQFATMAAPLTDLTKGGKAVMVSWNPEAERAFQELKVALCNQPVLITPDFKKEFVVQTDASDVGLGAVLSQEVGGEEHPVTYLSRKLSPAERNYSIVERECLAIKWALESLKYYLLGRSFRLITDHSPLTWMCQAKERNARVTRWFLTLQNFKFTVEHRAGKLQGNADALSRTYCLMADSVRPHRFEQRGRVCKTVAGKVIDGRYLSPRILSYGM